MPTDIKQLGDPDLALVAYANYVAQDTGLSRFEAGIILNSLLDYAAGQEVADAISQAILDRAELDD